MTLHHVAPSSEVDHSFSAIAPSALQAAVYENVARGIGHTLVSARAGCGKTTTIMGALKSVSRGCTVALFAFNNSIKQELAARVAKQNLKNVEVKTLHAHGFAACRRAFPGCTLNDDKSLLLCEDLFGEPIRNHPLRGRYRAIQKLVSKAKDVRIHKGDLDALDMLVDTFDIDCPEDIETRGEFVAMAMKVLARSAQVTSIVDFSDMCWLPVVLNLRIWTFDRVFVDETQDLSPCQIELLLRSVKPGGRICAVGDERQAIYAFRGADVHTIPNLIKVLKATVLPLSVTYRCARAIVQLANIEVPDLQAADDAPEGYIGDCWLDAALTQAAPGDMIISRSNAPLLGACLKLLASGKRAAIKGRDVGAGIVRLIDKSKATTVDALLEWLDRWHAKETARLVKDDRPTDEIDDKVECIRVLTEGVETVVAVRLRAETLFADDGGDAGRITLGTTHRLKGLEADRVWMLADTYRRESGGEESNVWYVAITRAKTTLMMVRTRQQDDS